jgi:hypothetical protein
MPVHLAARLGVFMDVAIAEPMTQTAVTAVPTTTHLRHELSVSDRVPGSLRSTSSPKRSAALAALKAAFTAWRSWRVKESLLVKNRNPANNNDDATPRQRSRRISETATTASRKPVAAA